MNRQIEGWLEDTCDVVLPDGTVCGAHVGWGMRAFHIRICDEHLAEEERRLRNEHGYPKHPDMKE